MRKAVQAAARVGGKKSGNKDRSSNGGKNDDRESARGEGLNGNNHNGAHHNNNNNNGNGNNNNGILSSLHEHTGVPMPKALRKTTPEEAALTAKNYRLAKELSELRVRHREECKNVTRLTMENVRMHESRNARREN